MAPLPPRVHIPKQGTIEGSLDPNRRVVKFLNIPFGTIKERWRPAVKPEPWTGIRDGTKQGPAPPQPRGPLRNSRANNSYSDFDFDDETTVISERDCLNLNIFVHEDTLAQAGTGINKAAVMVFIHGGGYRDGCNSMDVYDGTNLVLQSATIGKPVIVVAINYRQGFLGFFSCPSLVDEIKSDPHLHSTYEKSAGNWALMDQRLGLEWVRSNIHAWGGQANNITAFGESYGSTSIHYHMLIQEHAGLFERAIMQSGAANSGPAVRPEVEGQLHFDLLVDHFKIPKDLTDREKLDRLKKIPDVEMGWAAETPLVQMFGPYIDGYLIPEDVRVLTHKTELYDHGVKTIMVGDVHDEAITFVPFLAATTLEGWPRVVEKYCPPTEQGRATWDRVLGLIKTDADVCRVSNTVLETSLFLYPDFSALRALSKRKDFNKDGGLELYQYYFDRPVAQVHAKRKTGAHHAVDLVFMFGPDLAMESVFTEEEKQLSKEMQSLWIKFAHGENQDLNRITRPVDDFEYHRQAKEAIVFGTDCTVQKAHCARQGQELLELFELSEKWVHKAREGLGTQGLKAGLLGIAQPGETKWT